MRNSCQPLNWRLQLIRTSRRWLDYFPRKNLRPSSPTAPSYLGLQILMPDVTDCTQSWVAGSGQV
jgi:hypothetical protein